MTVQPQEQVAEAPPAASVLRVDWAPVPRVNLLPPEVLAARKFRSVRWRLVLAVVVTLAVAAGGVAWAQSKVGVARRELAVVQDRTGLLNQQVSRYSEVPKALQAVDAVKAARESALGKDVLWYRFLNDVALATSSSVSLSSMTVELNASATGTSTATDPLAPAGIGVVTVKGTATGYPAVVAWMRSIAGVSGFGGVTLESAAKIEPPPSDPMVMTFTAHLVLTDTRLSHRYDRKAG